MIDEMVEILSMMLASPYPGYPPGFWVEVAAIPLIFFAVAWLVKH